MFHIMAALTDRSQVVVPSLFIPVAEFKKSFSFKSTKTTLAIQLQRPARLQKLWRSGES